MNGGEREMTLINPGKEYWLSLGSNQQPPIFKSCTLLTELWGLTWQPIGIRTTTNEDSKIYCSPFTFSYTFQ